MAAAAGGCILLETRLIEEIGGFKAIRQRLIDDCALAKRVKSLGYRTWIGLTHSVHSLRSYETWRVFGAWWHGRPFASSVTRRLLLAGTTVIMLTVFWLPVAGLFFPAASAKIISACALAALILSYLPTLKFYGQSRGWAVALPLIASSLSCHDLVVGNPVLGWNRITLERKILREAQEVLIPAESVDQTRSNTLTVNQYSLAIMKRAISLSGSASGPNGFRASTAISTNSFALIFDSSTPNTEG